MCLCSVVNRKWGKKKSELSYSIRKRFFPLSLAGILNSLDWEAMYVSKVHWETESWFSCWQVFQASLAGQVGRKDEWWKCTQEKVVGISVIEKVEALSNSQRLIHVICAGKWEFFGLLLWRWNTDRVGEYLGLGLVLEAISCRNQG